MKVRHAEDGSPELSGHVKAQLDVRSDVLLRRESLTVLFVCVSLALYEIHMSRIESPVKDILRPLRLGFFMKNASLFLIKFSLLILDGSRFIS